MASSIPGTIPTFREVEESAAATAAVAPTKATVLARMSLLPVETEEEWRRKKELQTLRRMEAKRRRSENQRSTKENNISFCREERESGMGLSLKRKLDLERKNSGQPGTLNLGPRVVVAAAGVKGKSAFFGSLEGLLMAHHQQQQQQQGNSQVFVEAKGDCSSGVSELESKTTNQGSGSTHPTQERGSQDPPLGLNKQPESSDNNMKEVAAVGGIEYMPCVFTIGDGPNGRKVEGILYKYCRGEEVRIMYVCHDSFFSPVEFVKHAGGHDVEHPLKHIFVNPPRPSK